MDHEYRIKKIEKNGKEMVTPSTPDSKEIGREYKEYRKYLEPGQSVELQKRKVNPWETVEKESHE